VKRHLHIWSVCTNQVYAQEFVISVYKRGFVMQILSFPFDSDEKKLMFITPSLVQKMDIFVILPLPV
jgi:hypothetical protein